MASHQGFKAWFFRNQSSIYTIGSVCGAVGLNWFFSSKSNKELDGKIEKYHVENQVERIAGEQRLRDFIQFGLSKDISDTIQGKKDDKKDGKD